jgi:hypothetical protein
MLIDRYLPKFDETHICEASVAASPAEVYAAIRTINLRDPLVDALFAVRELPLRIKRRLRGERPPAAPPHVTFGSITTAGPGWVQLAEEPDVELVIGSVGRFWRKDYGGRPVLAEDFIPFRDPGYAKLAISLAVRPAGDGSILRYEARTATTDEAARRTFRRYWRLIVLGVALVMRRVVDRIKTAAEEKAATTEPAMR